jgi:hypothetical protein
LEECAGDDSGVGGVDGRFQQLEASVGKNYVILNFSDYKGAKEDVKARGAPVRNLVKAFKGRVRNKGGTVEFYHMSDLLAHLRHDLRRTPPGEHDVKDLLDASAITGLCASFRKRYPYLWAELIDDCQHADKIIFSAHGHKDDTDSIYCDHNTVAHRCGNVRGIAAFLSMLLEESGNVRDPTITLVVCFAARAEEHSKDHLKSTLSEADIRSSLAFKLFKELSNSYPGLRLTARTGAMSAAPAGTSLLSQTEKAIIAAEQRSAEYPGEKVDEVITKASRAIADFETAITKTRLSKRQRDKYLALLDTWFKAGCKPADLGPIIEGIDQLDTILYERDKYQGNLTAGEKLRESVCSCLGIGNTWEARQKKTLKRLMKRVEPAHRISTLNQAIGEKKAKYGKFEYRKERGRIVVSRWVPGVSERYQLTTLMSLIP